MTTTDSLTPYALARIGKAADQLEKARQLRGSEKSDAADSEYAAWETLIDLIYDQSPELKVQARLASNIHEIVGEVTALIPLMAAATAMGRDHEIVRTAQGLLDELSDDLEIFDWHEKAEAKVANFSLDFADTLEALVEMADKWRPGHPTTETAKRTIALVKACREASGPYLDLD